MFTLFLQIILFDQQKLFHIFISLMTAIVQEISHKPKDKNYGLMDNKY